MVRFEMSLNCEYQPVQFFFQKRMLVSLNCLLELATKPKQKAENIKIFGNILSELLDVYEKRQRH